jgi:hypothetical protein
MDTDRVMVWIDTHRKFLAALVAAAGVAYAFAADGEFSQNDLVGTVLAFLGAGAVERVPNDAKPVAVAKRAGRRAARRQRRPSTPMNRSPCGLGSPHRG